MKRPAHKWIFLVLMISVLLAASTLADTLQTTPRRITSSTAYETTPTLGNDGTTDLVVYTLRPALGGGLLGPGDIWYQPLVDGAPNGLPVQVTTGATDDQLNDVSGDYDVYAYDFEMRGEFHITDTPTIDERQPATSTSGCIGSRSVRATR